MNSERNGGEITERIDEAGGEDKPYKHESSESHEDVFEAEEHPRNAYIFVPQSRFCNFADRDISILLGRMSPKDLPEAVYFSLRSSKDRNNPDRILGRIKSDYPLALGFFEENYILPLPSFNHNFLTEDLADGHGSELTRIAYVARYKESDISQLAGALKKMLFGIKIMGVG